MADKHYSVVLTVDLSCSKCYDKIKKVLSKHQDRWDVQSIVWDEKHNKITLTGPFCPRKLSKKLCKKACKVIKAIDIPDLCECDKEKPKPPAAPKPDPPKPAPPKPETPKPAPPPAAPKPAPPAPEPSKPAPPPPKAEPAPPPPKPKPTPPEPGPAAVPDPYPPVWPVCFGGPWCECGAGGGHHPPCGCRCGCGGPCHGGCRVEFFCEEDSTCRPM